MRGSEQPRSPKYPEAETPHGADPRAKLQALLCKACQNLRKTRISTRPAVHSSLGLTPLGLGLWIAQP